VTADTRIFVAGLVRGVSAARRVLVAGLVVAVGVALLSAGAAFALPEGRHYEMVSPPYKGGYGVYGLQAVAVQGGGEGDVAMFSSLGTFAGAPSNDLFSEYVAHRGADGWFTGPVLMPASLQPASALAAVSPSLGSVLFLGTPGSSSGVAEESALEKEFLWHPLGAPDTAPSAPQPGPNFATAGVPLARIDGKRLDSAVGIAESSDLCHILFRTAVARSEREPLLPEATGSEGDLYDMATGVPGCVGEPVLRLVGVGNISGPHGEPAPISAYCHVFLGSNAAEESNHFNAVSADGSEIFFTSNAAKVSNGKECDGQEGAYPANPAVLYVRLNGEHTLQVSKLLAADCQSGPCKTAVQQRAEFAGANETGSRVFFTTTQPLVTGDTDTSKDLYMASIGCPAGESLCEPSQREVLSLVQVSHNPTAGESSELQGVVDVAPNGGRVYFVARGVLSEEGPTGEGVQSKPVKGADNLYVYDAEEGSGTVRFVADLCSGPGSSGEATDLRCPSTLEAGGGVGSASLPNNDIGLWSTSIQAQTAGPDGRFLVFATWGQLVSNDTDTTRDVYRYDAASGEIERVSVGEAGHGSNGNSNTFGAQLPELNQDGEAIQDYELGYRAVSEDGSRIVFETGQPLSPNATNGLVNAYEWHEGHVGLVSDGSDEEPVGVDQNGLTKDIAITPSGRDLFFVTVAGLLPQDTDGARDVYDARLEEGFPESPANVQPCSGDACQGPLTNPAPLLVPGSVSQLAGENLASPRSTVKVKPKKRAKRKIKSRKHRASAKKRTLHRAGGRTVRRAAGMSGRTGR
jgi:hypothetical protein